MPSPDAMMTAVSPADVGVASAACPRRGVGQDDSDVFTDDEGVSDRRLTPLEQLNLDMCQDDRVVREITIGRRIGFYKIRGEIGCGNFSHVKLGVHALTKGTRSSGGSGHAHRSHANRSGSLVLVGFDLTTLSPVA